MDQFGDLVGIVVLSGFLVGFCPFDKAREIVARPALLQVALLSFCCFLLVLTPLSVCGRWQALHGPLQQDSLRGMGTGFGAVIGQVTTFGVDEHGQYLI